MQQENEQSQVVGSSGVVQIIVRIACAKQSEQAAKTCRKWNFHNGLDRWPILHLKRFQFLDIDEILVQWHSFHLII